SGFNDVSITDSNAIILGTLNIGNGALNITANNSITQTGAIVQAFGAGTATFTTGNAPITLTNTGNILTGAVSLNNTGANDVLINNSNNLQFATSNIGGNLQANASGAISQ